MKNYKVSVIIPIYGVQDCIERCAVSLLSQSYDNIEYLFVNDCTPDKSISILKSVIDNCPPQRKSQVHIINHSVNKGISAVRNTALDVASGEFVLFVDSDDFLEVEFIEKLVSEQMRTYADIVTGEFICYNVTNGDTGKWNEPQYETPDDMLKAVTARLDHYPLWGRLIRRSILVDNDIRFIEGFNYGEDLMVLVKLLFYAKSIARSHNANYYYVTKRAKSLMMITNNPEKKLSSSVQRLGNVNEVHNFLKANKYKYLKDSDTTFLFIVLNAIGFAVDARNKCYYPLAELN